MTACPCFVVRYVLDDNGEADYRVAHAVMAGLGLLVIVLSLTLKCTIEAGAATGTTAVASAGAAGEDEPLLKRSSASQFVDAPSTGC